VTPFQIERARANAPDIDQHPFAGVDREGVPRVAVRFGVPFALTAAKAVNAHALLELHPGGHVIDRRTGAPA
jgi:hypothetical protein